LCREREREREEEKKREETRNKKNEAKFLASLHNTKQLPPNPIVGGGMAGTRAVSRIRRSGVLSEDATTGCAATPGTVRRDCAWGHRPLGVPIGM